MRPRANWNNGPSPQRTDMNIEIERERAKAQQICAESGVKILPYGDAWWLLGNGVSRVVGTLAGLSRCDLVSFTATAR